MVLKYQQLINQPSRDQQAIAELLQASVSKRGEVRVASPQTSFGVRLSRIHFSPMERNGEMGPRGRNGYVTNEPQRTSAGGEAKVRGH